MQEAADPDSVGNVASQAQQAGCQIIFRCYHPEPYIKAVHASVHMYINMTRWFSFCPTKVIHHQPILIARPDEAELAEVYAVDAPKIREDTVSHA